jgi:hypothetical protein
MQKLGTFSCAAAPWFVPRLRFLAFPGAVVSNRPNHDPASGKTRSNAPAAVAAFLAVRHRLFDS